MHTFLKRMDLDFDGEVSDSEWDHFWVLETEGGEGPINAAEDFKLLESDEGKIKVADNEIEEKQTPERFGFLPF